MRLSIYIHDFHPQIGHARAMLELLNGLDTDQKDSIHSIEVIAFTCSDLEKLFPDFKCPKYFTQIPFPRLKPFLLKMIFYHLISLLHSITQGRNRKKLGIGIACLNVDIVNVQFIHKQWEKYFFQNKKFSLLEFVYKKLLFAYFSLAEKYVYSFRKDTNYIVIANFIKDFLNKKFHTPADRMTLIPSGVNSEEFKLLNITDIELHKKIVSAYPEINEIDTAQPIALFVGALERKGIDRVLETLKSVPNAQLIVIGKSENPRFKIPKLPFKIIHIPFTMEVSLFYQIADTFIFPTRYEPFGLVIIEAYAMGLDLLIPIENVGASEIIPPGEGVQFFHQNDQIQLLSFKKISFENKQARRKDRLERIKNYNWQASADMFYKCLMESSK